MAVGFARPDVSHLIFHLYERSVHPELFQVHAVRSVRTDRYAATVKICDAGHVVQFTRDEGTIVEVMGDDAQLLPTHKRTVDRKVGQCRDVSKWLPGGLHYQSSYQLERVESDVYQNCHEEFLLDCQSVELSHHFPGAHRFAMAPLSLIRLEVSVESLLVHTFHTFPESSAIVRSQSLFEC